MAEDFRDNEARERFEVDVEGHAAFVTYRKSPGAITLVHTEVPPELGGKGVGSKLAHATLEAVRAQGRKLTVECDFIRNFMSKHAQYNELLAPGQAANEHRDLQGRLLLRRGRSGDNWHAGLCRLLPLRDCQAWSAAPVNAFSLWKSGDVQVTKGASDMANLHKTKIPTGSSARFAAVIS